MTDQQVPVITWYKNKMYWLIIIIIVLTMLCYSFEEYYGLPHCYPLIHSVECGL